MAPLRTTPPPHRQKKYHYTSISIVAFSIISSFLFYENFTLFPFQNPQPLFSPTRLTILMHLMNCFLFFNVFLKLGTFYINRSFKIFIKVIKYLILFLVFHYIFKIYS